MLTYKWIAVLFCSTLLFQCSCLTRQVQKTNVPPPQQPKVVTQEEWNKKTTEDPKSLPPAHTKPLPPNNNSNTTTTRPPITPLPSTNDPATKPSLPPKTLPADTTTAQPTLPPNNSVLTTQMDIALLLPFNLPNYYEGMNTDSLPEKSKVALDFYEGILCGLDYLRSQGITPNVRILDSENNSTRVKSILTDPTLGAEIDLIIGPIYNGEIKEVATFAKQNKIYLVSPLSPSNQNAQDNPYYIITNPSVETHCKVMFDYITNTMLNSQIITISSTKTADQNLATQFSQFATAKRGEGINSGILVSNLNFSAGTTSIADLEALMTPTRRNVFVVTSYNDEALIIDLSNKLIGLSQKYDIAVFGMPNWTDLPNLPLDILAQLNFHYTTAYWDNQSLEIQQFKQAFYNKFKIYPNEYAGRAYDLIRYFGQALKNKGKKVGEDLGDKAGIFTDFKFRPSSIGVNKNSYIENNSVNIIKFRSDYLLEKVNR